MKITITFFVILLLINFNVYSQDPKRFQNEIKKIEAKYTGKTSNRDLVIFTGSSSIRRWENIKDYFPGKNIINTAFGGSHMSDLLYYADTVILKYKPSQVFVYEGDNDLGSGKKPESIIMEAETLCSRIHKKLPRTQIVIISAKPSPSRWALRDNFLKLNSLFRDLADKYRYIEFIDLWTPLLANSGRPRGELYVKDSLHLNDDGYRIWAQYIKKVIE